MRDETEIHASLIRPDGRGTFTLWDAAHRLSVAIGNVADLSAPTASERDEIIDACRVLNIALTWTESGNFDVVAILPDGRRGYFDGTWLWTATGTTIHHRADAEVQAETFRRAYPGVAFVVERAGYGDTYERICNVRGEAPEDEHSCDQCGWSGTGFHACPGLPGENE